MRAKNFRPIASTLTRAIWRWSTLCACLIGLAQLTLSYYHVHQEFEAEVRAIGSSNVPLLSVSIWDIEPAAVQRQIEVIAEKQQIGFVCLTVSTGQIFKAGDAALSLGKTASWFEVPAPERTIGSIGKLEIYENPRAFYREMIYNVLTALIGYGILTLLICTLVVYFLKRELEHPLRHIAQFVSALTPDRLTTPLKLERPAGHQRDEIDLVVEGFQVLQDGVSGYISHLDELVVQRTQELEIALESIQSLSTIDFLTGCFNRRLFNERIAQELDRAERYQRPISLIFCDIDHFKLINDTYGHLVGDQVLQGIAKGFERNLRAEVDWVARYGGEEFVIVLPETGLAEAITTAERLRQAIKGDQLLEGNETFRVTASFGVAQHRLGETAQVLIQEADTLLYKAKQGGRNRVCPAP